MLQVPLCCLQLQEKLTKQFNISQAAASKLKQSEVVITGLKKKLEVKEEVLKSNNETQIQLQTDIDGLTKTVQSLNQMVQRLCDTPEHVSTYKIEAVAMSKWTEISPAISRVKLLLV
jgi:predicted methyltransferase